LPQVELGTHKLRDLKLVAIDLSPIGKACGGQIDGILGVDLLDQMGMTIDLKRRVAVPAPAGEPEGSSDAFAEVERDMGSCDVAFNHGDVMAMEECFDPEIVFYTQHGEYRGREEVMHYLSQRFFKEKTRRCLRRCFPEDGCQIANALIEDGLVRASRLVGHSKWLGRPTAMPEKRAAATTGELAASRRNSLIGRHGSRFYQQLARAVTAAEERPAPRISNSTRLIPRYRSIPSSNTLVSSVVA
jgi:hypothetical protein